MLEGEELFIRSRRPPLFGGSAKIADAPGKIGQAPGNRRHSLRLVALPLAAPLARHELEVAALRRKVLGDNRISRRVRSDGRHPSNRNQAALTGDLAFPGSI